MELIQKQIKELNQSFGVMFHHFHDDVRHPKGQGSLSAVEFEKILIELKNQYNVINAKEYSIRFIEGSLKKKDICLTFDDNLSCQYEIAYPILKKHGLTAFWFIYSSPLIGISEDIEIYRNFRSKHFRGFDHFFEAFISFLQETRFSEVVNNELQSFVPKEYLSKYSFYTDNDRVFRFIRDQVLGKKGYKEVMDLLIGQLEVRDVDYIKTLWNSSSELLKLQEAGHVMGLHSHSHPTFICDLSYEDQKWEYLKNKMLLDKIFDQDIDVAAYPCGHYNDDTFKIMEKLGVTMAFKADLLNNDLSRFTIPRLDHTYLIK